MVKIKSNKEIIEQIKKKVKNEKKEEWTASDLLKFNIWIYWWYVNYFRAFQNVNDWLKPVWRRLLFSAYENNLHFDWWYKKSANVVWYCMWNYHPHGDSYWTLAYLAQDFSLKYPLLDPQWNFWSIDWSWPAASRYTEIRLSKISDKLILNDLNEITKEKYFAPNFTWEKLEPKTMPVKVPFSLLNWTSWIWVWINTYTLPHNLNEVIKALISIINWGDVDKSIIKNIKWFDTIFESDIFITKEEYKNIYLNTWRGSITIRWKIEKWTKWDVLIVRSLPIWETTTWFLTRLEKKIKDKKIIWIKKVRDFWFEKIKWKNYLNIIIRIDKKADIEKIIKKIYKNTNLEKKYNLNYTFINNNKIETLSIKDVLLNHIEFRKEILKDIFTNRIVKLEKIKKVMEAKLLAIDKIDEIIKIIRNANSDEEILSKFEKKLWIEKKYWLIILDIQLRNIKKLNKKELNEKLKKIKEDIKKYKILIKNEEELKKYMISELEWIYKEFNSKRIANVNIIKE